MARPLRTARGGICYHVINRGNGRANVFRKPEDFAAFERILSMACERFNVRLLAWVLMTNHFHLVLWPRRDGDLQAFMQWATTCHVRRYHKHYKGSGHVWQGRYRSFPIEPGGHLLSVLRYVERNPVRAGMVAKVQDWRYSSAKGLAQKGVWLRSEAEVPDPFSGGGSRSGGGQAPFPSSKLRRPEKEPDPAQKLGQAPERKRRCLTPFRDSGRAREGVRHLFRPANCAGRKRSQTPGSQTLFRWHTGWWRGRRLGRGPGCAS